MKVCIVGGVAGGASAAARLRRLDEQAEIILFERGAYISFANCGLPYHVGGVIKERQALLLQSPEAMHRKYNIDVRIRQEVVAIDREQKLLTIKPENGENYTQSYDQLVLATGSSPLRPPIAGIDSPHVTTLWTVPDADRIRALLEGGKVQRAVVVGGGFIGLEMAENLVHAGVQVTLVEQQSQVMAPLDFEMAQLLHETLEENGVQLHLSEAVQAFSDIPGGVRVRLQSGKTLDAQLVILAAGVRPNSALAKGAHLQLGARGGIVTDAYLRTADPSIWAVGDAIEVERFGGGRAMIPLAGPANKQGRIVANNICGGNERYEGTQGTSVAKVFGLTAASTGDNERALLEKELLLHRDYESITITQNSHAGYYPGAVPMTLKLLFAAGGKTIFGAQIVGADGVDKRIDLLSAAIRLGAEVSALRNLECAYAPPYSSAKDPVNMAGFVAQNVLAGLTAFAPWDVVEKADPQKTVFLDVREDAERAVFSLPGAVAIPLGQLRDRLAELDRGKEIVVFCAIGVRAHNAARILSGNGFERVRVYPGGMRFYRSTHYRACSGPQAPPTRSASAEKPATSVAAGAAIRVDCSGLQCPGPVMRVFETIEAMKEGEVLEVTASDPGFARDIEAWCRRTGHSLLEKKQRGTDVVALIRKASAKMESAPVCGGDGKTIVVFSGDLDKALASFIIASGAAALGRKVTMFFTFWGLNILRRPEKKKVKKTAVEAMFAKMMPRGAAKLKLSKMNMAGMGTAMMKKVMREKNVDSLQELMEQARRAGVKMVACTMSMDVMGIRPEELIDGVELGGVGAYLGDAEESNVNLFI